MGVFVLIIMETQLFLAGFLFFLLFAQTFVPKYPNRTHNNIHRLRHTQRNKVDLIYNTICFQKYFDCRLIKWLFLNGASMGANEREEERGGKSDIGKERERERGESRTEERGPDMENLKCYNFHAKLESSLSIQYVFEVEISFLVALH